MENNAYVYRHRRLDTNEIFYVGIGSQQGFKRALDKRNRNIYWKSIIKTTAYQVEIIQDGLTWEQACELEILLISEYGRLDLSTGCLVNLTVGGEGLQGEDNPNYGNRGIKNPLYGKSRSKKERERMKESIKNSSIHNKNQKGGNNNKAKLILDEQTGIFYDCLKDACIVYNVSYSSGKAYLQGRRPNKTSLIYC